MTTDDIGFLGPAPESAAADRLFAHDRETFGFVMNLSRAWAHQPEVHDELFALFGRTAEAAGLTFRQRGVLISALASTMRDPHCSLEQSASPGSTGHHARRSSGPPGASR